MKYRINSTKALTRKMKTQIFLRWLFYALVLLFSYCLMSCGIFDTWQPYLLIALATAVAMRESEFSASMFGMISGFFMDMATGTLFGFHAALLLPCCLMASLLSRNLIKINFVNHLVINAATTLIIFSMYYLFYYVIWNIGGSVIVLIQIIIPSFIATVVMSIPVYFLVKVIWNKFRPKGRELDVSAEEASEEERDPERMV